MHVSSVDVYASEVQCRSIPELEPVVVNRPCACYTRSTLWSCYLQAVLNWAIHVAIMTRMDINA